jgi:hypothetical protein
MEIADDGVLPRRHISGFNNLMVGRVTATAT